MSIATLLAGADVLIETLSQRRGSAPRPRSANRQRSGIPTSCTRRSRRLGARAEVPLCGDGPDADGGVRLSVRLRRDGRSAAAHIDSAGACARRRGRGSCDSDRAARAHCERARPAHRRRGTAFADACAARTRSRRSRESAARRARQRLRDDRCGARPHRLSGARWVGTGIAGHRTAGRGVHAPTDELGGRGRTMRRRVCRSRLGQRRGCDAARRVQRAAMECASTR